MKKFLFFIVLVFVSGPFLIAQEQPDYTQIKFKKKVKEYKKDAPKLKA